MLATFDRFVIRSTRACRPSCDEINVPLARDVSLLMTQNFGISQERVSDAWLSADATPTEVRNWLANVARVARQGPLVTGDDVNRPPAFATALAAAVFGESKPGTLLNNADADYLLAVKDVADVPIENRSDLAMLCATAIYLLIRMPRFDRAHLCRGRECCTRYHAFSKGEIYCSFRKQTRVPAAMDNWSCARPRERTSRSG